MAKRIWVLGALAALVQAAWAEAPRLASVFGDHMVLQRDVPVSLYGTADAGVAFHVVFDGTPHPVTAGEDGRWSLDLPALPMGGPHSIRLKRKGRTVQTISDVLAGDVFLCSGQSNMEFPVGRTIYGADEAAGADIDSLRLLRVGKQGAGLPQADLPDGTAWQVSAPEFATDFSALCYFTGRAVAAYGVPVGLIDASVGGSRIEPWIGPATLLEAGISPQPAGEDDPGYSVLHNAMIAPFEGFRLKAGLWYQGESNGGEGEAYETFLRLLIADWRALFGDARLPVAVVQLPRWGELPSRPGTTGWGTIRESMRKVAASDSKVGLVVTIDTGDPADIHPPNKQKIAERMIRLLRALAYDERLAGPSGPEVTGVSRSGDTLRVEFAGVEKGLETISSDVAIGFEACSAEGNCRYVSASVDGEAVTIRLPDGAPADELRYCQGDAPLCNLFDGNGLPAGPFRMPVVPDAD